MDSSHKIPGPYEYLKEPLMQKWGEAIILNVVDMYGPAMPRGHGRMKGRPRGTRNSSSGINHPT